CVNVDLNAAGRVAQVEEVAFAHVAMRGDAARCTKRLGFLKLLAHLRNRSAYVKTRTERLDTFRAKCIKFFASQRDQLIFFFHRRTANLNRCASFATLNHRSPSQGATAWAAVA